MQEANKEVADPVGVVGNAPGRRGAPEMRRGKNGKIFAPSFERERDTLSDLV